MLPNRSKHPCGKAKRATCCWSFVMFSALLVVGLSAIIPQVAFEGQREKEEELLFRGQQYQRSIQLFFRKFGRYPNSLEELEKTNGIRFLRKAYLDPMTKEADWRLIHIGPGGSFPDAKNPSQASSQPGRSDSLPAGRHGLGSFAGNVSDPIRRRARGETKHGTGRIGRSLAGSQSSHWPGNLRAVTVCCARPKPLCKSQRQSFAATKGICAGTAARNCGAAQPESFPDRPVSFWSTTEQASGLARHFRSFQRFRTKVRRTGVRRRRHCRRGQPEHGRVH